MNLVARVQAQLQEFGEEITKASVDEINGFWNDNPDWHLTYCIECGKAQESGYSPAYNFVKLRGVIFGWLLVMVSATESYIMFLWNTEKTVKQILGIDEGSVPLVVQTA